MADVRYRVIGRPAAWSGQWEDPVGEAKGIVDNVIEGWERDLPADVIRALLRTQELLTHVAMEPLPSNGEGR